ncbi:bifunctional 4-alpha-glucanotransferase/amylo-alpha-1,6-glucosidase [Thecaphora frezii]
MPEAIRTTQTPVNANGVKAGAKSAQGPFKVFELRLQEDGSPTSERSYIRLPAPLEPYVLRFSIDAGSLASKDATLWSNFPAPESHFDRGNFVKRSFPADLTRPNFVDLVIDRAGVFEFFVEYTREGDDLDLFKSGGAKNERKQGKHGYFNVDPVLKAPVRTSILDSEHHPISADKGGAQVTKESQLLPLDGIVLQTLIAKWAGSLSEWQPHLQCAKEAGYNMLHFPPLNIRGASNSPYSIADQTDFSYDLFDAAVGKSESKEDRTRIIKEQMARIKEQWGILSMSDVVWNHTAHNSPWLNEHPEAAYNPLNSPHLTPAEELDRALLKYSARLGELGLPTDPKTEDEANAIIEGIKQHVFPELNLWQFYVLDVKAEKAAFKEAWKAGEAYTATLQSLDLPSNASLQEAARIVQEHALRNHMALSGRFITSLDAPAAASILRKISSGRSDSETLDFFSKIVDEVNIQLYRTYDDDVKAAIDNLSGRLKYTRIDPNGPRLGPITESSPFFEPYFTRLDPSNPACKDRDPKELALANNGWIWAADPLEDFASPSSRVYLRREVIVWGDCVKLRYGKKPEDSPFLWKHMEAYTLLLASAFDAFRIDNCHSTPIHVGEHFLDVARRANPNLYVCAELFTGSAEMDVYFVSRLGINSLIREMDNAHDPKEESRLLYRFGVNKPIGSMDEACLNEEDTIILPGSDTSVTCTIQQLEGSSPHALFMDLTHDNETPTSKRTTEDALTMGALVAFSWSAIGSTKGFDDLYPRTLDVVQESRKYTANPHPEASGIGEVKRLVNHLHTEMVLRGYSEGHVHQENDYIVMHRVHPQTHEGFLCLAHTAFHPRGKDRGLINPLRLDRTKAKFILGKTLEILDRSVAEDKVTLKGFDSKLVDIEAPQLNEGHGEEGGAFTEICIPDYFPPGSIMVFSTSMSGLGAEVDEICSSGATDAMSSLDLVDLNVVLYRADGEEKDVTGGNDGVYEISGHGKLVYCGLEGWMSVLRDVMEHNDLGHPLCAHLREGTWALDYVHNRLARQTELFPRLEQPAAWFKKRFDLIASSVPNFLRPKYFALVINTAYKAARSRAISQMSKFVKEGHDFTKSLSLCAVQMNGTVKTASLWPDRDVASMAAGLPFFSASWARLWGRDVFISLRGLYLATGMYEAAREHIIAFGSTLKHGLIPNLLDSGRTPRYNCRDGPWFFAQNVQDYTKMVPGGEKILEEPVKRRFPQDDEWIPWDDKKAYSYTSTVAELIQEILQRHASGIHFREYNAGPAIDNDMRPDGFNIDIDVDWQTGILFGGNQHNCGTWQDKNGSSARAGNKGVPGSPRDGAAIEITALLKSTLSWIDELQRQGKWTLAKGVEATVGGEKKLVTYKEWADLIQQSFESAYFVPVSPEEDASYKIDSGLVNRRGIYKDVYGSSKGREWADYQFRSNFPIAMCVAPELFNPEHARLALNNARKILVGPLGMKTLDPADWNYRPDYDQTDNDDPATSCGWNYQ